MSSKQGTGSSTPVAGPSNTSTIDPYRTLSNALQKPLAPFLPPGAKSEPPTLSTLLNIKDQVVTSRLSGKNLTLDDTAPSSGGPSSLVTGRKRNRGDPAARKAAADQAKRKEDELSEKGLSGLRKVKKRLGGVIKPGDRISYESLLPLHYLHVLYLCQLLNLPPLPTLVPIPRSAKDETLPLPHGITMDGLSSKLSKADFTGLIVSIVAARNPSLVDLKGIIIEETALTYRLVGTDDKVRVVPKDGSQFGLSFPAYSPSKASKRSKVPQGPKTVEGKGKGKEIAEGQGAGNGEAEGQGDGEGEWETGPDITKHLELSPRIEITLLGTNFSYRSGDRAGRKFRLAQGTGGGNGWGEEWVQGDWGEVFDQLEGGGTRGGSRKKQKSQRQEQQQQQHQGGSGSHGEKGVGGEGMRKRGKSRRKDPLAGGSRAVVF